MKPLALEWLPGRYAVCRLNPHDEIPAWAQAGATPRVGPHLLSITRTDRELSIVIDESLIPVAEFSSPAIRIERDFSALRIAGTLDFSKVGIISKLTGALAAANIPIFVISTFETDIVLIKRATVAVATHALRNANIIVSDLVK